MAAIRSYIDSRFQDSRDDAKIAAMEDFINSSGYEVKKIDDRTYEVVKKVTVTEGDYLNPIFFVLGMTVEVGKWYTDGSDIWEALKTGVPAEWEDPEYFDVIF